MALTLRVAALALSATMLAACGDSSGPATTAGPATASRGDGSTAVPIEELVARANAALEAGNRFDPPEENAMALFLEVSKRQDVSEGDSRRRRLVDSVGGGDVQQQAVLAMNDLFPYGLTRVEQALRDNQLADAGRILDMLEHARPDASSVKQLRDDYKRRIAAAHAALRSTDFESLPQLLSKRLPSYPARAQRQGVEGWVHLSFAIQTDGSVDEVKVMAAEPEGVFDREAIKALQLWRFEPPSQVIRAQRRIEFSLDEVD